MPKWSPWRLWKGTLRIRRFGTIHKNPSINLPTKQETFLNSYRQIDDPELRRIVGDSPVMGIHLGLRGPNGIVRLGDPIYVGVPDDEVPSTLWPSQLHRWDSCEISEYEWSPEAKVANKHEKRSPRSMMRYQYNFTHRIYDCACETFSIGNNWWFGRTIVKIIISNVIVIIVMKNFVLQASLKRAMTSGIK